MSPEAIVEVCGDIPAGLVREFLQHIRSFDKANVGCHFSMFVVSNTSESAQQIAAMLEGLDPPIPPVAVIPFKPIRTP
jgi:hypothetical protein